MAPNIRLTPIRGGGELGPVALSVEVGSSRMLLDCGSAGRGPAHWAEQVGEIESVWASHAHLDHCGALPDLLDGRPRLECLSTVETADLLEYVLQSHPECDAARSRAIAAGMRRISTQSWFDLPSGGDGDVSARAMAFPAGHLLGAASVLVEARDEGGAVRLLYTGDFCCHDQPLVPGAVFPRPSHEFRVDALVMEGILATNERADGVDFSREIDALGDWVRASEGPTLVAVQPVGESVEFAAAIADDRVTVHLHEDLGPILDRYRRSFGGLGPLVSVPDEELGRVLSEGGVAVVAGDRLGSGSAARRLAGRIVDVDGARIALTNRAYESTLAGELLDAEEGTELEAFPDARGLRADVRRFDLPTHAPRWQLVRTVSAVDPGRVILVHGREGRLHALRRAIERAGFEGRIEIPGNGATLEIGR